MQKVIQDLYNADRVKNSLRRVSESNLSKQNKTAVRDCAFEMSGKDFSQAHIATTVSCLKNLAPLLDFSLGSASRNDLLELVGRINRDELPGGQHSVWTLCRYKMSLRVFFRVLEHDKGKYDFIKVEPKKSEKDKVRREELLVVSEVEEMVEAASNWRDKAFLALLWDSGMRMGEIMALKWKDISFDDELAKIYVRNGKNGVRSIPVVESVPLLRKYRDESYTDPDSYLWSPVKKRCDSGEVVTCRAMSSQVDRIRDRTDIPEVRRTNPHAWRKARATCMASRGMTQPNMNAYFGWVPGSTSGVWYIRLASRDVEKSVRRMYGLPVEQDEYERAIGRNISVYDRRQVAEVSI